jgi:MoxR-like ATPase
MSSENEVLDLIARIKENIARVMVGKEQAADMVLIALICGGHILIEDVPGLGKTTLVAALARTLDCSFRRIQFTPDVLPSDVTGFTSINLKTGEREVNFGAVMAQIVLADEINRTSPKTQSSLLEVMQEGQVTIDGVSYPVPQPFIVLATQNPVELIGTYPLPEAQLDRFMVRLMLGYVSEDEELRILADQKSQHPLDNLQPVADANTIVELQNAVEQVTIEDSVMRYLLRIVSETRHHPAVRLGVSTRGSLQFSRIVRARALMQGRNFAVPEDVKRLAQPVLAHRLVLDTRAKYSGTEKLSVIDEIISKVPVPR